MKRLTQVMSIITVAACLLACGGSDNAPSTSGGGSSSSTGNGTGTVVGMLDYFGNIVALVIGTTSEASEPISIDSITPTTPDNTQPAAISQ